MTAGVATLMFLSSQLFPKSGNAKKENKNKLKLKFIVIKVLFNGMLDL